VRRLVLLAVGLVLAAGGLSTQPTTAAVAAAPPSFSPAFKVDAYGGGTESRITVAPNGKRYIASNRPDGTAEVYQSIDGVSWHKTPGTLPGQQQPTIDVDIVAMHTGRLFASELDLVGPQFVSGYSDDEGKTWTASQFDGLVDQDRQWFAVGPDDATTHQPRVYLLYHNLFSGQGNHNMFVATSTDGGATFGAPVPTTLPGSQAYLDLQCADSGGPSNIMVNPTTGRVYAVFGTRTSPLPGGVANVGGCGASLPPQTFQFNIVAATKVWVVSSPDGSLGSWSQSVAVGADSSQNIVGMQLDPGTMDTAGNIYVTYPESPGPYPGYGQAAVKMTWAPADLGHWSTPVTVAPGGAVGNLLVHSIAGRPGQVDLAYFSGVARPGKGPLWYATAAQTLDGLSAHPTFTHARLSDIPTYTLSAASMMGACTPNGIINGLACNRSTDVWGVALDNNCNFAVTWPVSGDNTQNDVSSSRGGTYAASQVGGTTVCSASASATAPVVAASPTLVTALPNTSPASLGAGLIAAAAGLVLTLVSLGVARRRRVSAPRR
jgi:hypothetical protein